MDLIVRNVRVAHSGAREPVDIGVAGGKIVAIEKGLAAAAETYDAGGRLACGGLIETHIHLDKSRIIDRTQPETGRRINPMKQVAALKSSFTVEDVRARAERTLTGCILHGAKRTRTQVEVELAREFDVEIDIHLDVGDAPEAMDIHLVCELTEQYRRGGRVAVGHMAKLSTMPPSEVAALARRLADTGVAVTVLPLTDLFVMGRDQDHNIRRGVADANFLVEHGVDCSLSTNNVLNPVTPYGDCSLLRMANLHANVLQIAQPAQLREIFAMLTERSARLLNLTDYGIVIGNPADIAVID